MNWFNKQGNCSIILELGYYHKERSLICLEGLWKRSWMGSILNMILIGWIVYYICVLEEDVSQLRVVSLSKRNSNNTIEKGQLLWSSIDKHIVDTIEALDMIVDSLIDQSTSLCFVGLYLLFTAAFFHRQLYMASSSLLCS
jgi:hypothetical protein